MAAVLAEERTVRVKAGPGSGKTRVVVARTQHLIQEKGVHPARILAVTFTNKACKEVLERLERAGCISPSSSREGRPLVKTFHSLGLLIMRGTNAEHLAGLGLAPGLKAVDEKLSKWLLEEAIKEVEELLQQRQLGQASAGATATRAGTTKRAKAADAASTPTAAGAAAGAVGVAAQPKLEGHELAKLAQRLSTEMSNFKIQLAAMNCFVPDRAIRDAVELGALKAPKVAGGAAAEKKKKQQGQAGAVAAGVTVADRWAEPYLQEYYSMYERLLRASNVADFADLICLPVRLLTQHPTLRDYWAGRFDHILVDEFQDTDPAQYRLVQLLRSPHSALFIVGDPDQAIYGWRGAEVKNMGTNFMRDYPDTATYKLSRNYRSDPAIVDAADAILCARDTPDELYSKQVPVRPATGAGVSITEHATPEAEAKALAEAIKEWARDWAKQQKLVPPRGSSGRGGGAADWGAVDWRQVAILYRKRTLSRPLEEALMRRGLPFTVIGGVPFWQREEIIDAVAYLHVVGDLERCDPFLLRIINKPARGLGDAALKKLKAAARDMGTSVASIVLQDCDAPLSGSAADASSPATAFAPDIRPDSPLLKLTKAARAGVQSLRGVLRLARWRAANGAAVGDVLQCLLSRSGYRAMVEYDKEHGEGKRKGKSKKDEAELAAEQLERLDDLVQLANDPDVWLQLDAISNTTTPGAGEAGAGGMYGSSEGGGDGKGLEGIQLLLDHAALVTGEFTGADKNAVQLMTLHGSKGLEWSHVFLCGVEEGILPSARSEGFNDREEERRVFFVGCTRARDALHVSWCRSRRVFGGGRDLSPQQPSSFLAELVQKRAAVQRML